MYFLGKTPYGENGVSYNIYEANLEHLVNVANFEEDNDILKKDQQENNYRYKNMLAKRIFSYQADEVGFKAFVDFFRCKEEMAKQPSFILHHGDTLYRYYTPVVLEEPAGEGGSMA